MVTGLTSCSGGRTATSPLPTDFSRSRHDTRLFEGYRVQSPYRTTTVQVPRGTLTFVVHVACRTRTDLASRITVRVGTSGAGARCSRHETPGYVGLSDDHPSRRVQGQQVTVRAPEGATWSVAVDAGPNR